MKQWMVLVACGLLAGCDYTVPLAMTPEMGIDAEVVGLWQRTIEEGQLERLLVLPLSKQEYLVSFPAGATNAMFARACLFRAAGKTLVQLAWFGTAKATVPEGNRVFQFAACTLAGDRLTVRLLNAERVNRDAKSADELAKAIADNKDKPDLFRDEMVFSRVKDQDQ